jgi:Fic family protein
MVKKKLIFPSGSGRSFSYRISVLGRMFTEIDVHAYCAIEPDQRYGQKRYNQELFPGIPKAIFSSEELKNVKAATAEYTRRTKNLPPAIEKRELERLVIELAWKSSKIEGNTYTLLDTEKLILEKKEAPGHLHSEAQMISNHKNAFTFVREHAAFFKAPSRAYIEKLHSILVKDLNVGTGLRERMVGVLGSVYQPLDNKHQLREGLEELIAAIARRFPTEALKRATIGRLPLCSTR